MSHFSVEHFSKFCSRLRIDSKEQGQIPLKFLGTQQYFVDEIAKGISEGVHNFICLKSRQQGITTASLALDLYWLFSHKGLQGALVTDTDDNKIKFRSQLTMYMASLPSTGGWKVKTLENNRTQLLLKNRSKLLYIAAGTKKNAGNLGAGSSANLLHGTECALWGDEDGLASLIATLAETNPNRLYIWESTAYGYNMFYQMWEAAKKAKTQRAIFIGWWRNELYQLSKNSIQYKTYWDGSPTTDERVWLAEIYRRYKVNLTDTQIAWYRWKLAEEIKENSLMEQSYPGTEEMAFQMSGSKFFSAERANHAFKFAMEQKRDFYRYKFGMHFEQTEFIQTGEANAELSVWEYPDPKGVYVLGADPAYGSSEWADLFAVNVLRCFADKVVQVAEFKTADLNEAQFAWVVAHIAGSYKPCMVNLEMQGPGGAVFNELQNLRRYAGPKSGALKDWFNVKDTIRDYFWRKQDSIVGGLAYQWQTNSKEKIRMMTTLRSYFEREMMILNSPECVAQFRNIRRDGDQIGGEGRAKDDLVISLAIAVVGWNDWIMREMQAENRTYFLETRPPEPIKQSSPLEHNVLKFFKAGGIKFP